MVLLPQPLPPMMIEHVAAVDGETDVLLDHVAAVRQGYILDHNMRFLLFHHHLFLAVGGQKGSGLNI
jgi:hypothetical protein